MTRLQEIRESLNSVLKADGWCASDRYNIDSFLREDAPWLIREVQRLEVIRHISNAPGNDLHEAFGRDVRFHLRMWEENDAKKEKQDISSKRT